MPTLAELFPIQMSERPLRFAAADATAATLARDELQRTADRHRAELDALLVETAGCAFQLQRIRDEHAPADDASRAILRDALEILQANLQEALDRFGVVYRDLTQQPYVPAHRDCLDIRGSSVNPELTAPRVGYLERPPIYRGERLLARGAALLEVPRREGG